MHLSEYRFLVSDVPVHFIMLSLCDCTFHLLCVQAQRARLRTIEGERRLAVGLLSGSTAWADSDSDDDEENGRIKKHSSPPDHSSSSSDPVMRYLRQLQSFRVLLDLDKCVRAGSWLNMSQIVRHAHVSVLLPNLRILNSSVGSSSAFSSGGSDATNSAVDVAQLHSSVTLQQARRDANNNSNNNGRENFFVNNIPVAVAGGKDSSGRRGATGGAAALSRMLIAQLTSMGQHNAGGQVQAIVDVILCAASTTVTSAESLFSTVWLVGSSDSDASWRSSSSEDPGAGTGTRTSKVNRSRRRQERLHYELQVLPSESHPSFSEPVRITVSCDEHILVTVSSIHVYTVRLRYRMQSSESLETDGDIEAPRQLDSDGSVDSTQLEEPLPVLSLRTRIVQHLSFARGIAGSNSGACWFRQIPAGLLSLRPHLESKVCVLSVCQHLS